MVFVCTRGCMGCSLPCVGRSQRLTFKEAISHYTIFSAYIFICIYAFLSIVGPFLTYLRKREEMKDEKMMMKKISIQTDRETDI